MFIYHRLSKNKQLLEKLTQDEIFNYLKKLYPNSVINYHHSMWKGTYILMRCESCDQEIRVELNKWKYRNKTGEIMENGKKLEDISKNSYIFTMKKVDYKIINKFNLQIYIEKL